jgi:hypothetical protein
MRQRSAYAIGALGAVLALGCFCASLEVTTAMAHPEMSTGVSDPVNRTLKGDRLEGMRAPATSVVPLGVQTPRAPSLRMQDGCEPAFSTINHSPSAHEAGSCVT